MNKSDRLTLASLEEGSKAKVIKLLSHGSMRRRLQDIGLVDGTNVTCLHKSPSGDPVAYLIRGAVIALRLDDSRNVLVETII